MFCAEHLDNPGDVDSPGIPGADSPHADSPSEADIVTSMSSPTKPQSIDIFNPNSTGIVLTKGSGCIPCSPITLAASQSKNDEAQIITQCGSCLDGRGNQVLQPLASSPTPCVDLDNTLVPVECKCAPSQSCQLGFDLGGHHECVSRKEHVSLLH